MTRGSGSSAAPGQPQNPETRGNRFAKPARIATVSKRFGKALGFKTSSAWKDPGCIDFPAGLTAFCQGPLQTASSTVERAA